MPDRFTARPSDQPGRQPGIGRPVMMLGLL